MAYEGTAHDSRLPVCLVVQRENERRFDQLDGAVHELHGDVDVLGEKVDIISPKMDNFEQWQKRQNGTLQDIQRDNKDTQKEIRKLREDMAKIFAIGGTAFTLMTFLIDKFLK